MTRINLKGLLLLAAIKLCYAGQGMYVEINSYIPDATLTLDNSQCVTMGALLANTNQYVEATTSSLKCLLSSSYFNFSIWDNTSEVTAYKVNLAASGSSLQLTYPNNNYTVSGQFYPTFGPDTQSSIIVSATNQNTTNWMSRLNQNLTLGQLVYPGTHDSGTSAITENSFITADADPDIAKLAELPGAKAIIAGWSKAQNNDIYQQLNSGVRYLDLRLCGSSDVNNIYLCHALSGETFTQAVAEIKQFSSENPSEIVIVDMNHWYNTDNNPDQMASNVYQYLASNLSSQIAARSNFNLSSSLNDLRASGKSIIVSSAYSTLGNSYLWTSASSNGGYMNCINNTQATDICSYWPNTTDVNTLETTLGAMLAARKNSPQNNLIVVQAQLTPDTQTIENGITDPTAARGLLGLTGTYKVNMTKFLTNNYSGLSGIITIEDFSNGIDLTELSQATISGSQKD